MIWDRTESKNVLRSGEWSIVKWPWKEYQQIYCLWHGEEFIGRYTSAKEAKEKANAGK